MMKPKSPLPPSTFLSRLFLGGLSMVLLSGSGFADEAEDLATRLDKVQKGNSFVRLSLKVEEPPGRKKLFFQVQIKERKTDASSDVLYQLLFPKDRKGESILLKQKGTKAPSGYFFALPDKLTVLKAPDLDGPLFGSDLAGNDIIENFFAWKGQSLAGTEKVEGKACKILVSKPGSGEWSPYGSVRSWIDTTRLVPLRVEKYDRAGKLVRTVVTTRVYKNDNGHHVPATMEIRRANSSSVTTLEGSKHKLNVRYTDEDFEVKKMTDLSSPRS